MDLEFTGEIIHWRGPAPFHFITVPDEESAAIEAVSSLVTYGWGAIPVKARIGRTDFKTSLFPKGDLYLVPIKDAVRRAETLMLGDEVTVHLYLEPERQAAHLGQAERTTRPASAPVWAPWSMKTSPLTIV